MTSLFGLDEDENESRDEGDAVAGEEVLPLEAAKLTGGVAVEEGQVYVDCHGQSPEGVSWHEPEIELAFALVRQL